MLLMLRHADAEDYYAAALFSMLFRHMPLIRRRRRHAAAIAYIDTLSMMPMITSFHFAAYAAMPPCFS